MTSESARDVLLDLVHDPRWSRWLAGAALDKFLAHPVELLALLAEPKVCPRCNGTTEHGPLYRGDICLVCGGTGSVAVDVLDLLGMEPAGEQWRLTGEVNWKAPPIPSRWTDATRQVEKRPVYAPKDGTP